ncbi:MAG TPA: galactose oxidase-like domain-containing protein [Candidatus Eisenbacteria bacterium]|nr:galactose oxidase-like domain-containing protein [Candidatus Eisenbacteria bacterium]
MILALIVVGMVPSLGIPAPAVPSNASVGAWAGPFAWPLVAVHMTLLPNGKVLAWDFHSHQDGVFVWDPTSGQFTPKPYENPDNLFCAGHMVLADGRVLVNGGHVEAYVGLPATALFDPATASWTTGTPMTFDRWYPSTVALPDGRALTISGAINCADCRNPGAPDAGIAEIPEIYDPLDDSWVLLPDASLNLPLYPQVFVLPDGRVLASGTQLEPIASSVLDVNGQAWSTVDPTVVDGGSAAMYLPGKVLKSGAAINPDFPAGPSSASTHVLDMTAPGPSWRQTAAMAFARTKQNLTILPDGTVLATGGSRNSNGGDLLGAVHEAELWSPVTETWTTMAAMQTPRMYHSTALLLPDGRVVTAGGGRYLNVVDQLSAEIYSPPYLFRGPRPTITSAPAVVDYGSSFTVTTPDAGRAAKVTLLRPGSVTHAFNFGQVFVPLSFQAGGGALTVQGPPNRNIAPPGPYMLFVVDTAGVPSVGRFVQLPTHEDTQPPTAPAGLTGGGSIDSVGLAWTVSSDNVAVASYDVHRSTSPGFTPSAATRIGLTASARFVDFSPPGGSQRYKIVARDARGNASAPSNEITFTTPPTPPPGLGLRAGYTFNEGSGLETADVSGHGYVGTLAGPTWAAGKYGSALSFVPTNDGNDSNDPRLVIGPSLDIPDLPLTISAWLFPTSRSDYRAILSKRDSPSASDMRLDFGLQSGSGAVYLFTGATFLGFTYAPPLNAWTHVAAVADQGSTRLYVGGNLQETLGAIPLGIDREANTVIGGTGDGPGGDNDPFSGRIDDLRIYERALSQSEIQADMNTPGGTVVAGVESPGPAPAVLRVFPNPFHAKTRVQALDSENVAVYSVSGRLIRSWKRSGAQVPRPVDWDGTDDHGRAMPSGIYLVKAGSRTARVALLR